MATSELQDSDRVLLALYKYFVTNPAAAEIGRDELDRLSVSGIPLGLLRPLMNQMCFDGYLDKNEIRDGYNTEVRYGLTYFGTTRLKELRDEGRDAADDPDWLDVVEFGPDDRAAIEATEATEKALQRIEADNVFAVAHPNERQSVVSRLTRGLEALKRRKVFKSEFSDLLLRPLRWAAGRFAGKGIDAVASAALEKLRAVFESWM